MTQSPEEKLQEYYQQTAHWYDDAQFHNEDEHFNALMFLRGVIAEKQFQSLLDVGTGTGRALSYLSTAFPDLKLVGLEPIEELRVQAFKKGFSQEQIILGNGENLPFEDNSFDCVTMFGVLHHIQKPEKVISEAFRVARKIVFISDHNIYGMGSWQTKLVKQLIRRFLGFNILKFCMTKGQGYHDTDFDGIFYPFSLFDHLPYINQQSQTNFLISTKGKVINLYSNASHFAVMAILQTPKQTNQY